MRQSRDTTIWRWFDFFPVEDRSCIVSLGEGGTPLLHARRLGARLELGLVGRLAPALSGLEPPPREEEERDHRETGDEGPEGHGVERCKNRAPPRRGGAALALRFRPTHR